MADNKREVEELRQRIAGVDREIMERLEARSRLSRQIHSVGEGGVLPADIAERDWLAELEKAAGADLPTDDLRAIFRQIRAAGRSLEQPVRVAYQGPEGGFCHATARSHFGASGVYA